MSAELLVIKNNYMKNNDDLITALYSLVRDNFDILYKNQIALETKLKQYEKLWGGDKKLK